MHELILMKLITLILFNSVEKNRTVLCCMYEYLAGLFIWTAARFPFLWNIVLPPPAPPAPPTEEAELAPRMSNKGETHNWGQILMALFKRVIQFAWQEWRIDTFICTDGEIFLFKRLMDMWTAGNVILVFMHAARRGWIGLDFTYYACNIRTS